MTTTAKLFMSGRSQAIRLPAKLRLNAKEVQIEQIGDALWMKPQVPPIARYGGMVGGLLCQHRTLARRFPRRPARPFARDA